MKSAYAGAVERLYRVNQQGGVKLGLENTCRLSEALGNPHHAYPVIHVGGTNGKGSVSTKVAAVLSAHGYRVGLYTSPHLTSFRERIRIGGELISEQEVVAGLARVLSAADQEKISATFFELTTLLAFDHFARSSVDVAVVEVGLGGRLDATNIVDPLVSVITSIGLDHQAILGQDRRTIAMEKGGIIKLGRPLVLGPAAQGLGLGEVARERGAPVWRVRGEYDDYLQQNEAMAQTTLEVIEEWLPVEEGALRLGLVAQPPCRFERSGRVLLDVAHNPDGLHALFQAIKSRFPRERVRLAMGASSGRDIGDMFAEVPDWVEAVHLITADHPRLLGINPLEEGAEKRGLPLEKPHGPCEEVIPTAIRLAEERDELLLVCGSCFLMGAAQKALGRELPSDPLELNEVFRALP